LDGKLTSHLSALIGELEKKVPYACALATKKSGTRINVNRVQENVEPEDPEQGLVITLWNGQQFFEYSTNNLEWEKVRADALALADTARAAINPKKPKTKINPGPKLKKDFSIPKNVPSPVSLEKKLEIARARLKFALSLGPHVANFMSILGDTTSEDVFVSRTQTLTQKITR
jgi:predicted Zn-dependent protease